MGKKSSEHDDALLQVPAVDILMCKILVWEPKDPTKVDYEVPDENQCIVLRECQSIEIDESYKKLIGTATVKFPRGTMVNRTITSETIEKEGTGQVYTERLDSGVVEERRKGQSAATPSDFKVGHRIRIYLGYYRDNGKLGTYEADAGKRIGMMEEEAFNENIPDFDGYIVKCSASTPIELKCENLASNLKKKDCPSIGNTGLHTKVNDLLKSGGKYDLLKGTGIELDPVTADCDIDIGMIQLHGDLTVADLLTEWAKYKLFSFIRTGGDGKPRLRVGRSYFSTDSKESIVNHDGSSDIAVIQFDYHVANDGLRVMNTDPMYLAVAAEGFKFEGGKQKKYSITVRLNPEWTGKDDTQHKKFQLLNETRLSQKSMKLGAVAKSSVKDKVDLSKYHVISYTASKIGISEEQLVKEAQAYFDGYNHNGIEGTVTIFGDRHKTTLGLCHIQSGMEVELLDTRQPEKNGWYLVEEVHTTFGTGGFRQTLKLPYCIAKPEAGKQSK